MRIAVFALAGLLAAPLAGLAATAAVAAVPNPVVALLGPRLGYVLAQSDLCGWNLADKITTTYQNDFKTIGLTPAQETMVWKDAAESRKALGGLAPMAKARMKTGICKPAARTDLEHSLTE